jgi:Flp pilus assembly protein TadG
MYMNLIKRQKGQTVIETALVIVFILMIFFGIAEIARAWWLKGQLNNAARVGARVAVVTSPLTGGIVACSWASGNCGAAANVVANAACKAITNQDLCSSPAATVEVLSTGALGTPVAGDEITVRVTGAFRSAVPGLSRIGMGGPGGWSQSLYPGAVQLITVAVMRHE